MLSSITDETQLGFIGEEAIRNLTEVEGVLRDVKQRFGIPVSVVRLVLASEQYHKNYKEGETFDTTGLAVNIMYDDGSTGVADIANLTLVTTRALTRYDRTVTLEGYGTEIRVAVTVTEEEQKPDDPTPPAPQPAGGCNGTAMGEAAMIAFALAAVTAVIFVTKKKEKRN